MTKPNDKNEMHQDEMHQDIKAIKTALLGDLENKKEGLFTQVAKHKQLITLLYLILTGLLTRQIYIAFL